MALALIDRRSGLYTMKHIIATSILTELASQLALLRELTTKTAFQTYYKSVLEKYFTTVDGVETLSLYIDKVTMPDEADIPFINIIVDGDENNNNGSPQNTQTDVSFNIMVYDKLSDDTGKESDENVADKVEFMSGIIKLILENTEFTGIKHKRAKSRKFNTENNGDASNISAASVVFEVQYIENVLVAKALLEIKENLTTFRGKFQLKTNSLGD
jgi:hypothetical protein